MKMTQVVPPPVTFAPSSTSDPTLEPSFGDDPIRIIPHQSSRQYPFEVKVELTGSWIITPTVTGVMVWVNGAEAAMQSVGNQRWRHLYNSTTCDEYLTHKYVASYRFLGTMYTVKYPREGSTHYDDNVPPTDFFMAHINRNQRVTIEPADVSFYCDANTTSLCGPKTATVTNRTRGDISFLAQITPTGGNDVFSFDGQKRKTLFTPDPFPIRCDESRAFQVHFELSTLQSSAVLGTFWRTIPPGEYQLIGNVPLSGKVFPPLSP